MSRTVFILGAGASVEAGGPIMGNFIAKALRLLREDRAGADVEHFRLVFKAREKLQRAFTKSRLDLDNIEDLFASFEMAALLGRLADMDFGEIERLPLAMRRLIAKTLESEIRYPVLGTEHRIAPPFVYEAFVLLVQQLMKSIYGPVSIITFNYDLALDYALSFAGVRFKYCLSDDRDNDGMDLLKLHGSLNWVKSSSGVTAARLIPSNHDNRTAVPEHGVAIPTHELVEPGTSKELLTDPVIVPPTWNKGTYHRQFENLWRRAGSHLSEAENIVVIGYSAPPSDHFYRQLYALSTISDTMLERYICVGPQVGTHHKQLLGGVGTARKALVELNTRFSECYHQLLSHFDGLFQPRAFHPNYPAGQCLCDIARSGRAQAQQGWR